MPETQAAQIAHDSQYAIANDQAIQYHVALFFAADLHFWYPAWGIQDEHRATRIRSAEFDALHTNRANRRQFSIARAISDLHCTILCMSGHGLRHLRGYRTCAAKRCASGMDGYSI